MQHHHSRTFPAFGVRSDVLFLAERCANQRHETHKSVTAMFAGRSRRARMTEIEAEITEATGYLKSGGLGEVYGLAEVSAKTGSPKVQMDTSMALALCRMAMQAPMGAEFDWGERMPGNQGQQADGETDLVGKQPMVQHSAFYTVEVNDVTGPLYYFKPSVIGLGPYTQRHVDAIIDVAADGTLAGVELIDEMPMPPA